MESNAILQPTGLPTPTETTGTQGTPLPDTQTTTPSEPVSSASGNTTGQEASGAATEPKDTSPPTPLPKERKVIHVDEIEQDILYLLYHLDENTTTVVRQIMLEMIFARVKNPAFHTEYPTLPTILQSNAHAMQRMMINSGMDNEETKASATKSGTLHWNAEMKDAAKRLKKQDKPNCAWSCAKLCEVFSDENLVKFGIDKMHRVPIERLTTYVEDSTIISAWLEQPAAEALTARDAKIVQEYTDEMKDVVRKDLPEQEGGLIPDKPTAITSTKEAPQPPNEASQPPKEDGVLVEEVKVDTTASAATATDPTPPNETKSNENPMNEIDQSPKEEEAKPEVELQKFAVDTKAAEAAQKRHDMKRQISARLFSDEKTNMFLRAATKTWRNSAGEPVQWSTDQIREHFLDKDVQLRTVSPPISQLADMYAIYVYATLQLNRGVSKRENKSKKGGANKKPNRILQEMRQSVNLLCVAIRHIRNSLAGPTCKRYLMSQMAAEAAVGLQLGDLPRANIDADLATLELKNEFTEALNKLRSGWLMMDRVQVDDIRPSEGVLEVDEWFAEVVVKRNQWLTTDKQIWALARRQKDSPNGFCNYKFLDMIEAELCR